jgi:hypothetical protein
MGRSWSKAGFVTVPVMGYLGGLIVAAWIELKDAHP